MAWLGSHFDANDTFSIDIMAAALADIHCLPCPNCYMDNTRAVALNRFSESLDKAQLLSRFLHCQCRSPRSLLAEHSHNFSVRGSGDGKGILCAGIVGWVLRFLHDLG